MKKQPVKEQPFYYPELDGLRFLSFLLVFIHNAPVVIPFFPFTTLHDYGWIGVDLFLCLSAFLLTRLLMNERERTGGFNIRNFYIRRILRIWPLYFLAVLLVTAATTRFFHWTPILFLRFVGLMTFTDNLMATWFNFNTFAFAAHLWTISYEEQFYTVLPWALRWLLKQTDKTKWMLSAALVLAGTALRALMIVINAPYPTIYVLPFTHFVAVLGGFLLGLGLLDKAFQKIPHWLLLLVSFAYLTVIVLLPNKDVPGWHLVLIYPGISITLIVYVVLHAREHILVRLLQNKPLAYLGKISFGLYVYHFFGLNVGLFLVETLGIPEQGNLYFPLIVLLVGLIVTYSYAEISYRYVEKPFLKLKERFTVVPSRPI